MPVRVRFVPVYHASVGGLHLDRASKRIVLNDWQQHLEKALAYRVLPIFCRSNLNQVHLDVHSLMNVIQAQLGHNEMLTG